MYALLDVIAENPVSAGTNVGAIVVGVVLVIVIAVGAILIAKTAKKNKDK